MVRVFIVVFWLTVVGAIGYGQITYSKPRVIETPEEPAFKIDQEKTTSVGIALHKLMTSHPERCVAMQHSTTKLEVMVQGSKVPLELTWEARDEKITIWHSSPACWYTELLSRADQKMLRPVMMERLREGVIARVELRQKHKTDQLCELLGCKP